MKQEEATAPASTPEPRNPLLRPILQVLPIALLRAREATMAYIRPVLRAHGLTEQQWRVLRALDEKALDATTIADRVCLLPPSLSRILKDLADLGLVERTDAGRGPRRRLVALTDKARTLIDEVAPEIARQNARMQQRLGVEDYEALCRLLIKAERALTPPD